MCLSDCGRYYSTLIPHIGTPPKSSGDVVIHEIASKKTVCVIKSSESDASSIFRISPDEKLLAIESWGPDTLHLYSWPSGEPKENGRTKEQGWFEVGVQGRFDSTGNLFLVTGTTHAEILDTRNWSQKSLFDLPDGVGLRIRAGFFDRQNRPKLLLQSLGNAEVWDLAKGSRDWSVKNDSLKSENEPAGGLATPLETPKLVRSTSMKFVTNYLDEDYQVRSLEDGRLFATHKRAEESGPLVYSPDGRFLLCVTTRASWQEELITRLPQRWAGWVYDSEWGKHIAAYERQIKEFTLIDLETGTEWPGLPAVQQHPFHAAFREHDQKLITATDEGFYEWDLPPKWQWFTPWAWPALAVLLLLALTWRRLGRSNVARQAPA